MPRFCESLSIAARGVSYFGEMSGRIEKQQMPKRAGRPKLKSDKAPKDYRPRDPGRMLL